MTALQPQEANNVKLTREKLRLTFVKSRVTRMKSCDETRLVFLGGSLVVTVDMPWHGIAICKSLAAYGSLSRYRIYY